jgi:hypothetical protein
MTGRRFLIVPRTIAEEIAASWSISSWLLLRARPNWAEMEATESKVRG